MEEESSMKMRLTVFMVSCFLITSCAGVEIKKSPTAYGNEAGDYFLKEWETTSSQENVKYPSADFIAGFCGNSAFEVGQKEDWSFSESKEYADACVTTVANGLGIS